MDICPVRTEADYQAILKEMLSLRDVDLDLVAGKLTENRHRLLASVSSPTTAPSSQCTS